MSKKPILIFCGLIGCGKTTFAKYYLDKLDEYHRFNTDDVRKLLGKEKYSGADTPIVNEYMYSRARELLKDGKGVLFDSPYKLKKAREKIYEIGKELNFPILLVECFCSPETSIKRITSRKKTGELHENTNNPAVYHEYVKIWESPSEDLKDYDLSLIKLDSDSNIMDVVKISEKNEEDILEIIKIIEKGLLDFRI